MIANSQYVIANIWFDSFNRIPDRLKKFVDDLHSGKLHREFHHGPDPETVVSQHSVKWSTKVNPGDIQF